MKWKKTPLDIELIKKYSNNNRLSTILLSILYRRNILENEQTLKQFSTCSLYAQHNPLLLPNIDNAIKKIEESIKNGHTIYVFGDRDVDGVTATTLMVNYLESYGASCLWKVPCHDEPYGLTPAVIQDCVRKNIGLLITVDCGISNYNDILYAKKHGIDTIVVDHHNCPDTLPPAVAIINPKLPDSIYPYRQLSACALVYKFGIAWSLYHSSLFNTACLVCTYSRTHNKERLECVSVKNYTIHRCYTILLSACSHEDISHHLRASLKDVRIILVDEKCKSIMRNALDNIHIPIVALPSAQNNNRHILTQYINTPNQHEGIENFQSRVLSSLFAHDDTQENIMNAYENDCNIVALSAIADMMPLRNENRIFVRHGLGALKSSTRIGIQLLVSHYDINEHNISAERLSFSVIPLINAAGRMGRADIAVQLLLSNNISQAKKHIANLETLNQERKNIFQHTWIKIKKHAEKSHADFNGKAVIVRDRDIMQGITGLLAHKLLDTYHAPSIVVSQQKEIAIGSIRTDAHISATDMLAHIHDILVEWGGHDRAAGFRILNTNIQKFMRAIHTYLSQYKKITAEHVHYIDAEIPRERLTLDLFNIIYSLEPYGIEFPKILFYTPDLLIEEFLPIGRTGEHVKLLINTGHIKLPAIYWSPPKHIYDSLKQGAKINLLYNLEVNYYRHHEQQRISVVDCEFAEQCQ